MIMDLHNHTTYSYDGSNTPEEIIENAIAHNLDIVGICDHQFSVRERLTEYIRHIRLCRDKYAGRIRVMCGLEIGMRPSPPDFLPSVSGELDYCLFECLDSPRGEDLYEFLEWRRLFKCKAGLAHTDIFSLSARYRLNMLNVLKSYNIFWEINISGNYPYYYDFLTNEEKRRAVAESGITLTIGSDTHWIREYNDSKIKKANALAELLGNPLVFGEGN